MTEAVMVMNNHSNNTNDNWYTPQCYVESARLVMGGIDLDPASCDEANELIGADQFYSLENSAFNHQWAGRVWMNPPYSRIIKDFVNKLVDSYEEGHVTSAIVVTNNGTDTKWAQRMFDSCSAICLVKGRIGFLDETWTPVNNNNKGQIFTYFGNDPHRFQVEFSKYGQVFTKY
ncbi:MAG: DNA N-6-adenine-methyltransferase [Bacteroidales bacterium]